MRVLHVIDHMGLGGAQSVVKTFFESQKGNKDIILFSLRNVEHAASVEHANVRSSSWVSKFSIQPLFELRALISANEIEILHCYLPRSQIFGYLIKRFLFPDIKLIFHEQGDIFEKNILHLLLRLFRNQVDVFIACSRVTKKMLMIRAGIPAKKVDVLYNCIDLSKFDSGRVAVCRQMGRNRLGISDSDYVVGFAARIIGRKGWREYLGSAFNFKHNPNIKFLIAGAGNEAAKMKRVITDMGLDEMVIYLGQVTDMPGFYSILDLLVVPSHWEPMGITQVEAQAMHIPVIASNVPGLNEVIQHNVNGLLFEPGRSDDLTLKIISAMTDKNGRSSWIEQGARTSQDYSVDLFIERVNRIYESGFYTCSLGLLHVKSK